MDVYQQLFATVGAYVTDFATDLTKHDRAALAERPGVAFLHYARPTGTTLVWLPPIDADDYPCYGNRVKYLFGTADRDHILQQKIDLAKYHTRPSSSPDQFIAHHYDGQRLRPITVGDGVTIAERYAAAIRRVWNAERLKHEDPAAWRRLRDRDELPTVRYA